MADKKVFDFVDIFNHIIGNFVSGAFAKDDKGQITGLNPEIKKKIKPGFRGWTGADETVMAEIMRRLDSSGEVNIWFRWLKKLKKHQNRQLRLHAVNVYNEFGMESALGVIRAYLNFQEDDDDSIKTELLMINDIITEKDIIEEVKKTAQKEIDDTRAALKETVSGIQSFNEKLRRYVNKKKRR